MKIFFGFPSYTLCKCNAKKNNREKENKKKLTKNAKFSLTPSPKLKMKHCPHCLEMNAQLNKTGKSKRLQLGKNVLDML